MNHREPRPLAVLVVVLVVSATIPGAVAAGGAGGAEAGAANGVGAGRAVPAPDQCRKGEVRVYGQAKYYYDRGRFDPGRGRDYHPIRRARVDIVAVYVVGPNRTLATVRTDSNGAFGACVGRRGVGGYGRVVFARVRASTPAATAHAHGGRGAFDGAVYTAASDVRDLIGAGDSVRLGHNRRDRNPDPEVVPRANDTAFHLVDSALAARQFVRRHTDDNWTRRHLPIRYPAGRTVYHSDDEMWFEAGGFARSRQAVFHEYGHAVQFAAYGYTRAGSLATGTRAPLPDGCHNYGTETTAAYAFNEGWAEFFAARATGEFDEAAVYYNRSASAVACRPADDDGRMDGYRVEGAVAAALWDVVDDSPDDDDALNESFGLVLDGLRARHPDSVWDLYDYLAGSVSDTRALRRVFTRQGIDVAPPRIRVAGPRNRTTVDGSVALSGTVADRHSTVVRLQVRDGSGSWQSLPTTNESRWSFGTVVDGDNRTVAVRATDRWGNNATVTVRITTVASRLPPVAAAYDTSPHDGRIDAAELARAGADYVGGRISIEEFRTVASAHARRHGSGSADNRIQRPAGGA